MHKYSAFWLKEEFCYHYFYKSDILYRFFNDYFTNNDDDEDLNNQYNYITRFIPYPDLIAHIKKYFRNQISINIMENKLMLSRNSKSVTIYLEQKSFIVISETIDDADLFIFQPLRAFDSNFFIVEMGTTNSGWITPIKKEVLL